MTVELEIRDVRKTLLDYDFHREHGNPLLQGFFEFWGRPRQFSTPHVLADCSFFDLHVTAYVQDWGAHNPPPHPGIFKRFFPVILRRLMGPETRLTLFVQPTDRDSFDEVNVIETLLAPKDLPYVLFSKTQVHADFSGLPIRPNVGYLVFEWSAAMLADIAERWFLSPMLSIEGYISREPALEAIAALYFRADTEERVRELLRKVEFGFKVWPDNNGLLVLTDKLDLGGIKERLQLADLNRLLREAVPAPPG